jgi:hypothetical protein
MKKKQFVKNLLSTLFVLGLVAGAAVLVSTVHSGANLSSLLEEGQNSTPKNPLQEQLEEKKDEVEALRAVKHELEARIKGLEGEAQQHSMETSILGRQVGVIHGETGIDGLDGFLVGVEEEARLGRPVTLNLSSLAQEGTTFTLSDLLHLIKRGKRRQNSF